MANSNGILTEWDQGPQALTSVQAHWFTPTFANLGGDTVVSGVYTSNYNNGTAPFNVTLTNTQLGSNDQPGPTTSIASYATGFNFHIASLTLANGDKDIFYDVANGTYPQSSGVDIDVQTVDSQGNPVGAPGTLQSDVQDVRQFRVSGAALGNNAYVLTYATVDPTTLQETVSYQGYTAANTPIAGASGTLDSFSTSGTGESYGFTTLHDSTTANPSFVYVRGSTNNGEFSNNAGVKYETVTTSGAPAGGLTFIAPPYPSGSSSQDLLTFNDDALTPTTSGGNDLALVMRYSYVDASGVTQEALDVHTLNAETGVGTDHVVALASGDTSSDLATTVLANGDLAVGYGDGTNDPLQVQIFDTNGNKVGAPLVLPSDEAGFSLDTNAAGQLVVEWTATVGSGQQLEYDIYNVGSTSPGGGGSSSPYAVSTTTTNPDGSTSITDTQGSYFKNKPYYSFTDTIAADGTFESEVRYRNNGATTFEMFSSGLTENSVYYDTFNVLQGSGSESFVFTPGHGSDVVNGFAVAGGGHDVLSFAHSDFSSIAAILHNTKDTSAGALITDPTGNGDTVLVSGISKADLVGHAKADFKLHA